MTEYLQRLKSQIPVLIRPALFSADDWDAVLAARDSPDFAENWMRTYESLRAPDAEAEEKMATLILDIEQTAFAQVYAVTGASNFTEIAPAVSEDFGLFARAVLRDQPDPWLSGLFTSYRRGALPRGCVEPVTVPIRTLLEEA